MKPLRLGRLFLFYYTFPTPSTIVGYVNYSLEAGKMDILGTQFVNAGSDSLDLQSITLSDFTDGTDWIKIYTPGVGYETYGYYADTITDLDSWESAGEGWGDNDSVRTVGVKLDPGQGFWLSTKKNCTVTMPGEVLTSTSETLEIAGGKMDIMTSPYPMVLDIQKIKISNFTDGTDWLKVYTAGVGYETYTYFADTIKDMESWESAGEGWGDNGSVRTVGATLNPGQGFWISTKQDATVTISR